MKNSRFFAFAIFLFVFTPAVYSQCMMVPLSLNQRVASSTIIVEGVVTNQETFLESTTGQVYTINKIAIKAWLKNKQQSSFIYTRTEGGVYHNRATSVFPSLQLKRNTNYILFLNKVPSAKENSQLRLRNAGITQTIPFAGVQGAFAESFGNFTDVQQRTKQTELQLLQQIKQLTKQDAITPDGKLYKPQPYVQTSNRTMAITSVSPLTVRAGTTDAADLVTITGSGFGASAGTVFFSNADDGGATFIASGLNSDIVSWSDNSVTVKVVSAAGTGPVNINGSFTSPSNLTVQYAHTAIEQDFFGFAEVTRQRYYLRNLNGSGGYTFQFNTGFAANTAAVTAFSNAINSWRTSTAVNFSAFGTTSVATSANDGVNAVYFDPSLPLGTLAVCTSNFFASATGACTQQNTVWWLTDADIAFRTLPTASTTWQFGPSAPGATQYDFQSVALHEIGHAHGLGHVIAPGQVMHFAIANGVSARVLSANDIAAGTAKVSYSDDPTCFNPAGSGTPMVPAAGGTLPITLMDFQAKRSSETAVLVNWNTLQEYNNKGFFIERGETPQQLQKIGFVNGNGQSLEKRSYSFNDVNAGPYAWYYRITQQDFDGRAVSSTVIFVKADATKTWRVWANESGQTLQVFVQTIQSKQVQLQLFNTNGQLVLTKSITNNRTVLPVQHLQKGYYTYRLTDGAETISGKLFLSN